MVISFAGLAPPYVAVGAALAAGVVVVASEAPAVVAGVAEAFAVAGCGAPAAGVVAEAALDVAVAVYATVQPAALAAVVDGVLGQPFLVDADVAAAEPAPAVADAEFVEIVLAGAAFDRPAVAPVYVSAQPVLVDGGFAQPVPAVVSATAQFAVVDGAFDQFASDAQAVADAPDRSAFDGLAPGVSGQSVSEGLPDARVTAQLVVLFPVAGLATQSAFSVGLPKSFPAPPVFVCPARWIAGSPGSAVDRASLTYQQVRPPVFFPVPLAGRGADRVFEHPPVLQPVRLWNRSFPW